MNAIAQPVNEWIEKDLNVMIDLNLNVPYKGITQVRYPARIIAVVNDIACTVEYERDGIPVRRVVPRTRIHPAAA